MELTGIDTSVLTGDGDILELGDRFRLRLRIESDDIPASWHINGADCWGKVSEYAYDYIRERDTPRPDGFTGRARKLQVDRGYWMWWEPYNGEGDDWDRKTRAEQDAEAEAMRDLLERGFIQVGVTLEQAVTDIAGHTHWVEVDTNWVGGVDEFYADLIQDLAYELPDIAEVHQ